MGAHSASKEPRTWDRTAIALVTVFVTATVVGIGAAAVNAATPNQTPAIHCAPGESIVLHPNNTWECLDLTPDPSPTPSVLTPSPTPSVFPSASPSPTPTAAPTTPPASPTPSPTPPPTSASPTPSASPTIGPVLLTNCFTRLAQCGYPHPGNTGVPAGTNLTPYTGPLSITTANTVIDGKTIGCGLTIRAANVTIRNSRITGPCDYGVEVPSGNVVIEDSEIDCVNHKGTGVAFRNFTVRRADVRNCENAFHTGSNSHIFDSYITGVVEVDGGHGDGIQGSSGTNITVQHNTFDIRNPITSSIIWDDLTINNLLVADNFFAAGAYTVYCPDGGTNTVYRNNRFYAPVGSWQSDTHRPAFGFRTNCGNITTWANNYRDDNLSAAV